VVSSAPSACHVSLAVAAITIGVVSVTLSLIGLDLGDRPGTKTGEAGELPGGLVLTAVGIGVASGSL
jgi:putative Mn2+ efflux pump MntP